MCLYYPQVNEARSDSDCGEFACALAVADRSAHRPSFGSIFPGDLFKRIRFTFRVLFLCHFALCKWGYQYQLSRINLKRFFGLGFGLELSSVQEFLQAFQRLRAALPIFLKEKSMHYIRRTIWIIMLVNLAFLFVYSSVPALWGQFNQVPVDDWQYEVRKVAEAEDPLQWLYNGPFYLLVFWLLAETFRLIVAGGFVASAVVVLMAMLILGSIAGPMIGSITDQGIRDSGFAVGGAKDINNFRANIAAGYLPQPSDITYEGLFYDYHFDTGKTGSGEWAGAGKLFVPTWSAAVSQNPLTGSVEHFLAIGLKSQLGIGEMTRKKLNLVVVLDISGSMQSPFNRYYYDSNRKRPDMAGDYQRMTKLESACSSLVAMLDQLKPDDRLGIVLFNHSTHLAKPVGLIGRTDMEALKKHILELEPWGATNMEDGLEHGRAMLEAFTGNNPDQYENRIVFMTDAMPNTDDTSESGLLELTSNMAKRRIYLTFIGMGVDFNSQMVKSITQVKGANYYSVHSPVEFRKRLADEFNFMVNPMVFDLTLTLKASDCRILKVIGSPEADLATGRIMQVKTLFPSPTTAEGSRGGIILLQLDKPLGDTALSMTVAYEDRKGQMQELTDSFVFKAGEPGFYEDTGIRKGILLARYADLLRASATGKPIKANHGSEGTDGSGWSYWERSSRPLKVADAGRADMVSFREHFIGEISAIGDPSLEKETRVLDQLGSLLGRSSVEN